MNRRTLIATAAAAGATATVSPSLSTAQTANPLLAPWTGPYGGVPPFPAVKVELFRPALEAAMAENLANLDRIANDPAPRHLREHHRRPGARRTTPSAACRPSTASGARPCRRRSCARWRPRWRPSWPTGPTRITQNAKLFDRIEAVYNARERSGLTPEQQRLTWLYWNNFVRAGAKLAPAAKERIGEINQALATLYNRFSQNVLADETDYVLYLKTPAEPRRPAAPACWPGPPPPPRAAGARASGRSPTRARRVEPFLTYAAAATCARRSWRTFVSRGDNGDAHDNNAIITEILKLRAERAKLLGYPDPRALAPRERDGQDARARDGR